MVKRIRIGADSFRVHGLFDETGLFLLMEEGDILSDEDFMQMENFVEHNSDGDIFLLPKKYGPSKRSKKGIMTAPFSCCNADVLEGEKKDAVSTLRLKNNQITEEILPFLHGFSPFGMIFRGRLLNRLVESAGGTDSTLEEILIKGSFSVLEWLFTVQAEACQNGKFYYIAELDYILKNSFEGDKTFFEGIYDKAWYEAYTDFLAGWLKELSSRQGVLRLLVMQHTLFLVKYMIQANLDNLNKHLFEGAEGEAFLWKLGDLLAHVDDAVICGKNGYHVDMKNEDCLTWVLLILKYKNPKLEFDFLMAVMDFGISRLGNLRSRQPIFSLWTTRSRKMVQRLR